MSASASSPASSVLRTYHLSRKEHNQRFAKQTTPIPHSTHRACTKRRSLYTLISSSQETFPVAWCCDPKYSHHDESFQEADLLQKLCVYSWACWRTRHGTWSCLSTFCEAPIVPRTRDKVALAASSWACKSSGLVQTVYRRTES